MWDMLHSLRSSASTGPTGSTTSAFAVDSIKRERSDVPLTPAALHEWASKRRPIWRSVSGRSRLPRDLIRQVDSYRTSSMRRTCAG
jgi:hypothetical protein